MLEAGVPIQVVQRILNHPTPVQVLAYAAVRDEARRAAISALA